MDLLFTKCKLYKARTGSPGGWGRGSLPVLLLPVLASFCMSFCTHRRQRVPRFFHIMQNFSDHLFAYLCVGGRKPNSAQKKLADEEVKPTPSPDTGRILTTKTDSGGARRYPFSTKLLFGGALVT